MSYLDWRHSIGTRLNTSIITLFACYLLAMTASTYSLYEQFVSFNALSTNHFERVMTAAELTRDAELIASEVFESLVGVDRSNGQRSNNSENLIQIYQSVRDRLSNPTSPFDVKQLSIIDQWQTPYFDSLERFNQQLENEYQLKSALLLRIDTLFEQLNTLEQQLPLLQTQADTQFTLHALSTLSYCATSLRAERPGQLAQLHNAIKDHQAKLNALSPSLEALRQLRAPINELTHQILTERGPTLQSERATLSSARETRVLAQKITSATFNYYQALKQITREEIETHQKHVMATLITLSLITLFMIIMTVVVIFYIKHHVLQRLRLLYSAVNARMDGKEVRIPTQGRDEISILGHAFDQFAKARYAAEDQLKTAHAETEKANNDLKLANEQLHNLSQTDALTQIPNRRFFDQYLAREWNRACRHNNFLSLIMVDIDWFKAYNDHYGHPEGDACLQQVAQTLSSHLRREGECVARYGGEEFSIILPNTSREQATAYAELLRQAITQLEIPHPYGQVTISLGVATTNQPDKLSIEALIAQADQALYHAKNAGRNRVMTSDSIQPL
jgi:diguanylate cyclase (GGDEF)-like protein